MRLLSTPILLREGSVPDYLLKQHVTKLGLDFSLVTRWTAFVAVTNKIYNNNPAQTPTRPVPLAQVKGVSYLAYGNTTASSQSQPSQFTGFATPEPATILGLALIGLLFAWFAMRLRPARTS
jgi:Ca-activated chloride channel family protein